MWQKATGGNNGSGLACYRQAGLSDAPQQLWVLWHNFRTKGIADRDRLCGLTRSPLACQMHQ
jgi:hypothetical protein